MADLAVAVAGPGSPAQHAKPVTFTGSARNLGPTSATGVSLTDTLPSGSAFVSLTTSQGACTAPPVGATGTIVCSLGDLAAGTTATIDPVAANDSASADVQIK